VQPVLSACDEDENVVGGGALAGDFKFGIPAYDPENAQLYLTRNAAMFFAE
jgi:hypothetical protein